MGIPCMMFDCPTHCSCSERSIDLKTLKAMVPSRCNLGEEVCRSSCHAIGRRDGACVTPNSCQCTTETFTVEEFAKCSAESTCRIHCQAKGFATGDCNGWKCDCITNRVPTVAPVSAFPFDIRSNV